MCSDHLVEVDEEGVGIVGAGAIKYSPIKYSLSLKFGRILAALTCDAGLLTAFKEKRDIHTATAAKIFNVEPDAVTRDQRSTAKMVNFGIPYGISAFGLAQRLGTVSRTEAQAIIDEYFNLEFF